MPTASLPTTPTAYTANNPSVPQPKLSLTKIQHTTGKQKAEREQLRAWFPVTWRREGPKPSFGGSRPGFFLPLTAPSLRQHEDRGRQQLVQIAVSLVGLTQGSKGMDRQRFGCCKGHVRKARNKEIKTEDRRFGWVRDKSVLPKANPSAALCAAFQVIKRNMLHMRNLSVSSASRTGRQQP